MNILKTTARAVLGRPSIIILPLVLGFFCYLINMYNPVSSVISGLAGMTGSTAFEGIVSLIQMFIDPAFFPIILIALGVVIISGSLAAGIILSGYLNTVSAAVEGRERTPGEFRDGLKRFFTGYFLISLRTVPFMLLLGVFMLISSLPAIVVSKAVAAGKPELLVASVFVDILTAAVLLFGLLFTGAYILFWYPSAMKTAGRSFTYGKRLVDDHFWRVILSLFIFFIVFAVIHYAIHAAGGSLLRPLLGWVFDSAFFTTLSVYVFSAFYSLAGGE